MLELFKFLLGRGITFRMVIPWTGAEWDKCGSCGVRRKAHQKLDHRFKEK